jgi:phosphoribosyl-ATP pyrophosphohydrolase
MSDSLERLYQAVIAAKDLDPAISRTALLFQRGPAKMAKKLAEEAIEVVIDAVNGKRDSWSVKAPTFFITSPCCGRGLAWCLRMSGRKWSGASTCSE